MGMADATNIPSTIAFTMDLPLPLGLRFLVGIRDRDIVSITARSKIVNWLLIPEFNSVGNTPAKLVNRANMRARLIMKELLHNSVLTFM